MVKLHLKDLGILLHVMIVQLAHSVLKDKLHCVLPELFPPVEEHRVHLAQQVAFVFKALLRLQFAVMVPTRWEVLPCVLFAMQVSFVEVEVKVPVNLEHFNRILVKVLVNPVLQGQYAPQLMLRVESQLAFYVQILCMPHLQASTAWIAQLASFVSQGFLLAALLVITNL
jgi:hypothetical protein